MKYLPVIAVLLFATAPVASHAQTADGVGVLKCQIWIDLHAQGNGAPAEQWVLGFLSASNATRVIVFKGSDVLEDYQSKAVITRVDAECRRHPDELILVAASVAFDTLAGGGSQQLVK
jgi:hypothetical protein